MEGSRETALRFLKISTTALPIEVENRDDEERKFQPLRAINNLGNFSAVFVPGVSPSFIIKSTSSLPQVIGLEGEAIRSLSGFNTSTCERGFLYIDPKVWFFTSMLSDFLVLMIAIAGLATYRKTSVREPVHYRLGDANDPSRRRDWSP